MISFFYLFPFYTLFITIVVTGFLGFFFKKSSISIIICGIILSFFSSLIYLYNCCFLNKIIEVQILNWINLDLLNVQWGLYFDSLTAIMILIVLSISSMVHIYSLEYMREEPHIIRFLMYLSLFTLFMLLLVSSNNLLQLFVGWEGVGLVSYLLISFWFTRKDAITSAIKAIIVNRIGDFFFLIGIVTIFFMLKTFDFVLLYPCLIWLVDEKIIFLTYEISSLELIGSLFFLGAVAKSAQLGLHTWLPDAMEGPTPVSALIHAATMVTAGIFILLRCSLILDLCPKVCFLILIVGSLTTIFAATIGLFQNDIKKVIAYSTCSQLGYMMCGCGMHNYNGSLFHLTTHAIFKALLFLSAGSVIHILNDEQDMRKMGGLYRLIPLAYLSILIGSLTLTGFPYLSAYYSKEFIIEFLCQPYNLINSICYCILTSSVLLTSVYSFRLIILVFFGKYCGTKINLELIKESKVLINSVLIILCIYSIIMGYMCKEFFIGYGVNGLNNFFDSYKVFNQIAVIEFGTSYYLFKQYNLLYYLIEYEYNLIFLICLKNFPIILGLLGIWFSLYLRLNINNTILIYSVKNKYYQIEKYLNFYYKWFNFFIKKWNIDSLFNYVSIYFFLFLSYNITFKTLDRGCYEQIGPFGLIRSFNKLAIFLERLQSGLIYHYLLYMILGLIMFLLVLNYKLNTFLYFDSIMFFLLLIISFCLYKLK